MKQPEPVRIAILTVSDGVSEGLREDVSGMLILAWAAERGYAVVSWETAPDEAEPIATALRGWADSGEVDAVITTGGTGFTERDVTPEATRQVLEREAPGISEAIRQAGAAKTPYAWLSRAVCGIRARTLIVNLPGNTMAVEDGLEFLDLLFDHAIQLLRGDRPGHHPAPDA